VVGRSADRWDGAGGAGGRAYGPTDAARNQQRQTYSLPGPGEKHPGSYKSTVRNGNPEEQNQSKTSHYQELQWLFTFTTSRLNPLGEQRLRALILNKYQV